MLGGKLPESGLSERSKNCSWLRALNPVGKGSMNLHLARFRDTSPVREVTTSTLPRGIYPAVGEVQPRQRLQLSQETGKRT